MKSQNNVKSLLLILVVALVMATTGPASQAQQVREFSATISPTTVNASATDLYTITITNDASSTKGILTAKVIVPAGFTGVSITTPNPNTSDGEPWTASLVSTEILLGGVKGNNRLHAGESVSVSFNATAPALAADYEWTTSAYQADDWTSTPFTLTGSQPSVEVIATLGSISGAKFYDADTDGGWDVGEPAIEGFKIELYDDEETLLDMQFTDENGAYIFADLDPGTYTVKEVMPLGETIFNDITYPTWLNTTDDSITIEDLSGPSEDNNFGNVCIGCYGGGHSKGWWRNPNGETEFNTLTDPLGLLVGLNLRNADGTDFDPATYQELDNWLQAANATNMAYMLSAQLAAMELNVLAEFVDDGALVYAPGTDSANAAGFASISDLMSEANIELGTHGTALSGDDWRDYQEALKNALDAANNNVNFVCPEPCLPIEYPTL